MKIKNRLFLLGAAMAVMSSSAFADTTGTQTYKANIAAGTCVITGLNSTKTFSLQRNDTKAINGGHSLITPIDMSLSMTGCTDSSVDAQVNMQGDGVSNQGWSGVQLGALQGLFTRKPINVNNTQVVSDNWIPGQSKSFALQNGAGSIPVFFNLMKDGGAGVMSSVGTFSNTAEVIITENK
ncbi:type 1 fimbrial protein [Salmonella enterica]|nr:type 1 fimbrial protein [Salmonella enterica]ELP0640466.1 type 1 fimbrial protein [Salmonella enterica]